MANRKYIVTKDGRKLLVFGKTNLEYVCLSGKGGQVEYIAFDDAEEV